MKILINLAKIAMAYTWLILIFNIFSPFPGKSAIVLYILTVFLFMMHGLQLLMFMGAFSDKVKTSTWEKCSILLFGIFALLDIRRKYMS